MHAGRPGSQPIQFLSYYSDLPFVRHEAGKAFFADLCDLGVTCTGNISELWPA